MYNFCITNKKKKEMTFFIRAIRTSVHSVILEKFFLVRGYGLFAKRLTNQFVTFRCVFCVYVFVVYFQWSHIFAVLTYLKNIFSWDLLLIC